MATGISMLVGEGLLALGLWLWFFRFEKGVRTKSTERPELLGIFKFHKLKRDVVPVKPTWWQVLSAILGVLMMAIALSQALTTLGMNNDADMALFQGMLGNPLCWLLLCIVGPVCEELVFRVGIVRTLYRHKVPGWAAAAIGALAFALVHGNVTQGIPAFIIGVRPGRCPRVVVEHNHSRCSSPAACGWRPDALAPYGQGCTGRCIEQCRWL